MTDTTKIDEKAEALVLSLVGTVFTIDDIGQVWRIAEQRRFKRTLDDEALVKLQQPRRAEYKATNGYLRIKVSVCGVRVDVAAHRVVYRHRHGAIPRGYLIDHINRKRDDNSTDNLIAATPSENLQAAYDRGSRVGFARVR
jgi:hypothetical protein